MRKRLFLYLCHRKYAEGTIAQLVEQRTENPCVPGSIPGGTTGRLYCLPFLFKTIRIAECNLSCNFAFIGDVAEWTNAAVSKTVVRPARTGGSNPSVSALRYNRIHLSPKKQQIFSYKC